jgi:hypothetical protein
VVPEILMNLRKWGKFAVLGSVIEIIKKERNG